MMYRRFGVVQKNRIVGALGGSVVVVDVWFDISPRKLDRQDDTFPVKERTELYPERLKKKKTKRERKREGGSAYDGNTWIDRVS
jgi:hypothetical protein